MIPDLPAAKNSPEMKNTGSGAGIIEYYMLLKMTS